MDLVKPTEVGAVPTSASTHHAKALGHRDAAERLEASAREATHRGDYAAAATLAAEAAGRRALQGTEEAAAIARELVGGSTLKEGDSVVPGWVQEEWRREHAGTAGTGSGTGTGSAHSGVRGSGGSDITGSRLSGSGSGSGYKPA